MNNLQLKYILLILLLILSQYSLALRESEFIQKVLKYNKYLKKDQIYVDIKQIELDSSRDNYQNWEFEFSAQLDNSYYDINKDTTSGSIYEKNRLNNKQAIKVETQKRFLNNPSSFSASIARSVPEKNIIRYRQDDYHSNYVVNTYDTAYKISYKYPLLKYDTNAESLKTYHRNILDLTREKLDFLDAKEGFLVERLEEYLLWLLYQQRELTYKEYLTKIQNIKIINNKNNIVLNSAIFRAKADISGNNSKLQAQRKSLAINLNDNNILKETPVIDKQKRTIIINKDLSSYVINNNRSLLKLAIDKKLKQIDIKYYNNQNLPKLDLSIALYKNSNQGNTLTTEYDNDGINYTSSIVFSMPLGSDISNQADLEIAQLNLEKLIIDYDEKLQDILSEAESLNTELKLNIKTLAQYPSITKSTLQNTKLQEQYYANGKNKLKDLIDAYKDSRDVNLEYIDYVISYQQNILEYNDILDRLIN